MKRILIIVLVLIFTNTLSKAKEIDNIFDISADYLTDISIIQFIEDQCDLRAQDDNFNSSKLSKCYYSSIKSYEKEANKHLKNLRKTLPENNYNQLIEAQKQWKKYSNTYDSLIEVVLHKRNKASYGSDDEINKVKKHKDMTENMSYLDYLIKQKGVKK